MVPFIYSLEHLFHRLHWTPGLATVLVICVCVFIFDPLRQSITRFVDRFIFHSPDFQAILVGVEEIIRNSNNIEPLMQRLAEKLKAIWSVDHAGFVVWDYASGRFSLLPPDTFKDQIVVKNNETITPSDFLVRTLETERRLFKHGIVTEDEIAVLGDNAFPGERTTFSKMRRTMRWLGANACVPLMSNEQLTGFIVLGPKKNGSLYNDEDKKFLSHVAQIVSKALKNILLGKASGEDWETRPAAQFS